MANIVKFWLVLLTFWIFQNGYIANYNYGNVLYQNGKYEEAIEQYKKALEQSIPEERECSVRINYALAICKTVQVDESNRDSILAAIEKYESAIDVLTEKGCAHKEDDKGHSKTAEQLKKDIQEEIDRLKRLLDNQDNSSNNDDNNNNDNNQNQDQNNGSGQQEQDPIEEKMREIKENAAQDQRETEQRYDNMNNFSFNKPDRNW